MPLESSASLRLIPSGRSLPPHLGSVWRYPAGTEVLYVRTPHSVNTTQVYPLSVKRLRAFLARLPGGHRPPTGPLTTTEAADAEELRQETVAKDKERNEHGQDEAGRSTAPPASGT
jgi:hypothetical protein